MLLNHDINQSVESEDIKRFKNEVSEYLGVPITYASHEDFDKKDTDIGEWCFDGLIARARY